MSVKSDKKHGFSCGGNFGWDGLWLKNSTLLLSHSLTPGDSPPAGTHTVLSKSCCAAYLPRPKKGRSAKLCVERRAGIAHVHMYVWSLTGLVAGWIRVYPYDTYSKELCCFFLPSHPSAITVQALFLHLSCYMRGQDVFRLMHSKYLPTAAVITTRDTSYIAGKLTRTYLPYKNCRS